MSDPCPNCGGHEYTGTDPCRSCGYTDPKFKKLDEYDLMFCNMCGNHYTGLCPNHPDQCVKVSFK